MKKIASLLLLACATMLASATSQVASFSILQDDNGTYTVTLTDVVANDTPVGTIVIDGLEAFNIGTMTGLYADCEVNIQDGTAGTTWQGPSWGKTAVTMLARFNQTGQQVIDLTLPRLNSTVTASNVGDHYQMPNSDMEAWAASTGEPNNWHGFMSATGSYASTSQKYVKLEKSTDVHEGSTGSYSAVMTAKKILFVIANGTMTNGQLVANSMSATDTKNHAQMSESSTDTDANGDPYYMALNARPDSITMWLKYTQGTANSSYKASVSAVAFDGSYYQEPYDSDYDCVAGRAKDADIAASDWSRHAIAFDYDSYAANNAQAKAIFVTFATNATPGVGSDGDKLYVDDLSLIYNANVTALSYQGNDIDGFAPATTTYDMDIEGTPSVNDFTMTVQGADAQTGGIVQTTSDGGSRVVMVAVSADLLTATAYVINTASSNVLMGDVNGDKLVDISDVTTLIDYVLGGNVSPFVREAADLTGDGLVDISDVTALIDLVLSGK